MDMGEFFFSKKLTDFKTATDRLHNSLGAQQLVNHITKKYGDVIFFQILQKYKMTTVDPLHDFLWALIRPYIH